MNSIFNVLTRRGLKRDLRQSCRRSRWILPLIAVVLFLLSVPLTHAQTTAQLTGTVQDASGAVIPGADVTLIDQSTGITRVVTTNRQGLYAFPSLTPGTYSVKVSAKSFSSEGNYRNHAARRRCGRRPDDYADRWRDGCDDHSRSRQRDDSDGKRGAHQCPDFQRYRQSCSRGPRHDGAAEGPAGRDDNVLRADPKQLRRTAI